MNYRRIRVLLGTKTIFDHQCQCLTIRDTALTMTDLP